MSQANVVSPTSIEGSFFSWWWGLQSASLQSTNRKSYLGRQFDNVGIQHAAVMTRSALDHLQHLLSSALGYADIACIRVLLLIGNIHI